MARIDKLTAKNDPLLQGAVNTNIYATQPTPFTRFMRTFLPWQVWRFFSINLRMMLLIGREKHQHR